MSKVNIGNIVRTMFAFSHNDVLHAVSEEGVLFERVVTAEGKKIWQAVEALPAVIEEQRAAMEQEQQPENDAPKDGGDPGAGVGTQIQ